MIPTPPPPPGPPPPGDPLPPGNPPPNPAPATAPVGDRILRRLRHLVDPESMVGAVIVTVWSVLAANPGGPWVVLIVTGVGLAIHAATVDSGNHVALWFTSAYLFLVTLVALAFLVDRPRPVLLAVAASTVLAHNELVRVNAVRRRHAVLDPDVFSTSAITLGLAAGLGIIGTALAEAFTTTGATGTSADGRSWLWVPVATGVLVVVALVVALAPTRRPTDPSNRRWTPGQRIPPAPRSDGPGSGVDPRSQP